MKKTKGKGYWIASIAVAAIGIFLIWRFHPIGFVYAYGLLFSFWIVTYVVGRRRNKKYANEQIQK